VHLALTAEPVARGQDRIHIFVRGAEPALPEGLEWRVDGLLPAGRTAALRPAGASWAPNRLDVFVRAATTRFTGDSRMLGCDHAQHHMELQPLICSALLYSLDPVVGGLCMHFLGLSLE
jgi:hypothetical protein